MPLKALMTWSEPRKGWMKKYKRPVPYTRSARQLAEEFGCPATKTGTVGAANEWWKRKQAEIDSQKPDYEAEFNEAKAEVVLERLAATPENHIELAKAFGGLLPDHAQKFVANYIKNAMLADIGQGQPVVETGIEANLKAWSESKRKLSEVGEIHPARYASYLGDAAKMRTFFAGQGIADASAINAATVDAWYDWLQASGNAPITRKNTLLSFRQFVKHLYKRDAIDKLPKNLNDHTIGLDEPDIVVFKRRQLQQLLADAKAYGDGRVYLYLLLCLNCGFYQSDISELTYKTVSLEKGIILKARSKTGKYRVRYVLWPETLEALKKHANHDKSKVDAEGNVFVLLNANGGELVPDKIGRIDNVATAYWNMRRAIAKKTTEKGKKVVPIDLPPLKCLRKTGTTWLGRHKVYRYFTLHYLADSPRGVESRSYRRPTNKQFAAALEWLRKKVFNPPKAK